MEILISPRRQGLNQRTAIVYSNKKTAVVVDGKSMMDNIVAEGERLGHPTPMMITYDEFISGKYHLPKEIESLVIIEPLNIIRKMSKLYVSAVTIITESIHSA